MTAALPPSDRTRVRRVAHNADYEKATVHAIVDAAYLCHVAFADDKGTHCIPMVCWREHEHLYIHGSNGSRLVKLLAGGTQACVTITHLDGLVLARSAFSHSMNYRSAMIYGSFEKVDDEAEKRATMEVFMDKIAVGRQADVRPGNDKEFDATTILRISLAEAACKIRTGGPNDDEEDMAVEAWAGVLPFAVQRLAPVRHERCEIAAPAYVTAWDAS
ncbi:pyridoxamine 5'-phosphate oxidase family protein [Massilia glaciei]|uniref:Pyridoxamine 5'-phosphate oxidase family protein n=1 Tax=Massilia glaciei TaxID=1524097 RepID=A0A2U2HJB3_9BURK|nr:pyridoxamine 5'-phosphate oxidase family protein [Massilia glaciei]PWF47590.1 pyridoxamine 5'-phosphate oxidase family protein [Massilia glaciei]